MIPCEYCGDAFPLSTLLQHQVNFTHEIQGDMGWIFPVQADHLSHLKKLRVIVDADFKLTR